MILPAGLENDSVEIYRFENEAHALYDGKTHKYFELPKHIRKPFRYDYDSDLYAQHCLKYEMCISGDKDREEKFVACRYGNWDNNPDLTDGKLEADAPNCPGLLSSYEFKNLFNICIKFHLVLSNRSFPNFTLNINCNRA